MTKESEYCDLECVCEFFKQAVGEMEKRTYPILFLSLGSVSTSDMAWSSDSLPEASESLPESELSSSLLNELLPWRVDMGNFPGCLPPI